MAGTLRGALTARGFQLSKEALKAEAEGLIEKVDGGIKITTIRVHYRLTIPQDTRAEADRAYPATQSVRPAIAVEWDAAYEEV